MHSGFVRTFAAIALILPLAGCEQSATPTAQQTAEPAPPAPPPPPVVEQPPPIPPNSEVAINAISSVNLSRPPEEPGSLVIRASGAAISSGWTDPKLMPESDGGEDSDVLIYSFVATSPAEEQPAATPQQLDTELRVDSFPDSVMTIRIVAATNHILIPVAQ